MVFKQQRLAIPTNSEYSIPQVRMLLKEVEEILDRPITMEEWNAL